MADFGIMTITNLGLTLYAKAQTGTAIVFTKMQVGSGDLSVGQAIATLTALIDSEFDVAISGITVDTANHVARVKGTKDNTGMLAGLITKELGLFATDPDDGEILYAYTNAGDLGDYIPPAADGLFTRTYKINAAIGNATNVTIVVPQDVYATLEDLEDLQSETGVLLATKETPAGAQAKADAAAAIGVAAAGAVQEELAIHQADYAHNYKKDAGSTDAYVVALDPAITSYTEGMTLDIFCKTANTGAATLDAGGGAKDLRKYYNDALETGDIEAGAIITVKWDSANDWWQVTSGIKVTVVDGTTAVKGIVQLSTSTSSTSTTLAATPSAVKAAYDLANSGARILTGEYTGDGSYGRTISIGVTPKMVIVQQSNYGDGGAISKTNTSYDNSIVSGGFKVGDASPALNTNGITYHWAAAY